jgi:hypothetical protein
MKINPKQLEAVLALPGPKRYATFIKVAADQRCVWGLFSEGWALAATNEGSQAFPLWPASEYAVRCASGVWAGYTPREIDLDTLFENLLPKLQETGTLAAVFPTPSEKGVTPDLRTLESDLRSELSKIE